MYSLTKSLLFERPRDLVDERLEGLLDAMTTFGVLRLEGLLVLRLEELLDVGFPAGFGFPADFGFGAGFIAMFEMFVYW
jgi:hypothetical protein